MENKRIEASQEGDTISRQAALDALAKFVPYAICDESTESYTNGLTDAYNLICQLPSVQSQQVTGKLNADCISRKAAIDAVNEYLRLSEVSKTVQNMTSIQAILRWLPPEQPETCEGCKHLGKWENEVEYGYPSPCTRCKRRVEDRYER